MYNGDMMAPPVLFLRVGWMKRYRGPERSIYGAGSDRAAGNDWEVWNFEPWKGRCYGYASSSKWRTIDVRRIGGSRLRATGVLVIWYATEPHGSGQKVVGWWRNANVYRNLRNSPAGRFQPNAVQVVPKYHVRADTGSVFFLEENERNRFPTVPRGGGFAGRSNTWFADSPAAASGVAAGSRVDTEARVLAPRAGRGRPQSDE
jgi:hypothetical protein